MQRRIRPARAGGFLVYPTLAHAQAAMHYWGYRTLHPMCDFITLALPKIATESVTRWRRRGYELAEHQNSTLKKALPPTYLPWLLTRGGCSCELCSRLPKSASAADLERALFLRSDAAEIIQELAKLHRQSSFLYVHFYSGDVSAEPLPIVSRTRRTLDSLSSARSPLLRDELTELVPPQPRPSA